MNFIQKSGTEFLNGSDFFGNSYVDLLFLIIKKLGEDCLNSTEDYNLCLSIRLLLCLIENFRGEIDDLLPKILDINAELMKTERTDSLKSCLIQVVCMMFWYNPRLTHQLLQERDYLNSILQSWFGSLDVFTNDFEKERQLYGIAGLLSLPKNMLPKDLNMEMVAKEVFKVSNEIMEMRKNTFKLEEAELDPSAKTSL